MKRDKSDMEDDLRTEYDLKSLQVGKFGPGRKEFGRTTCYFNNPGKPFRGNG